MTPPTSSGFGTTMRTSRKSYSRKTLTHVSPGSMISSSTSDSDNSLHSLYFTSYHGLINYPQKIPATGEGSQAQIEAFEDTWHWNESAERAFDDVMQSGNTDAAEMLRAMRAFLKENDVMVYLTMMAIRLIELHRILKSTGSMYLHCDPTASHYLKLLIDAVFGHDRFRNEIIWQRATARGHAFTRYPATHDTLFFYNKGAS